MSGEVSPAGRLARRIRAAGPVTVADYMAEAAAHYYGSRDPFGAHGDFVTAPEVSQMFGELIGAWCADQWQRLGAPDPVILAELGPGRGTLMADLLRAARAVPPFRRAIRLHLVETSPALRQAQETALRQLGAGSPIPDSDAGPPSLAPAWHDSIATLPDGPLLLVANEFLDALPVRQFVRAADGWHERRIALDGSGAFVFVLDPAPSAAAALLPEAALRAPVGTLWEACPAALTLAAALGRRVAAGGAALFIDYGYFPSAGGDTLQALRRHRRHDVLADPGEADLTAHVDFATFAAAAEAAGPRAWGPVTQGRFLRALGIAARAAALRRNATPRQSADIDSACRRLLDPGGMGTLFKALALLPPGLPAPAGFAPAAEPQA